MLKSAYGLPDALRAWREEVTGYLRSGGFQHTRMDVAFMVAYHDNGDVGAMIVLHVGGVMIATGGPFLMEKKVADFHKKYRLGEWAELKKSQGSSLHRQAHPARRR